MIDAVVPPGDRTLPERGSRTLRLFAAGSLKAALTEALATFAVAEEAEIVVTYGASGLLKERIAAGEPADLFASADMGHPRDLAARCGAEVHLFARNSLCALTHADLGLTQENLLDRLLDPAVTVGTSTPRADPSGDYAFAMFAKADRVRAGSRSRLEAKARRLTGSAAAPKPACGRSVYAHIMAERLADIFVTYRTNALATSQEVPGLAVVPLPSALAVEAEYGLVVLGRTRQARRLAGHILGPDGQAALARHGFDTIHGSIAA